MDINYIKSPIRSGVKLLWKHSDLVGPFLKSQLYRKNGIRVSVASLVRIEAGERFLLVRNRHRPGYFAPLGGVIKYFSSAEPMLDALDFEREVKASTDHDLQSDLRGKIPAANLGGFLLWLNEEKDRESATDALRREIEEETREADMSLRLQDSLKKLQYRRIRMVHEGPYKPHALNYPQYRRLEVFSPISDERLKGLQERLLDEGNEIMTNYCLASKEEIEAGRLSQEHPDVVRGMEILPNTAYLFRSKMQKNEAAPI